MSSASPRTMLCELATQRHWQTYETFEHYFRKFADELATTEGDPRFRQLSVSRRQLERWFSARTATKPRSLQSRVLECMFELPVAHLMTEAPVNMHSQNPRNGLAAQANDFDLAAERTESPLSVAAQRARRFMMQHERSVGVETMAQLYLDVQELAQTYPRQPLDRILPEVISTQEMVFELLDARAKPLEMRDLYFFAAVLTGMLAKASHDLGDRRSAMMQARAAMVSADNADHEGLRTWILGLESLVAFWAGEYDQSIAFARRGWSDTRGDAGSARVWLPSLEARAHAAKGDREATRKAIHRAELAREECVPNELDKIGGMLSFSMNRQLYYAAEAEVLINGRDATALKRATAAVDAYSDPFADDWAFSDAAGSQSTLALAYVATGDADAAHQALSPVFDLETGNRINGVVQSIERVRQSLLERRYESSRQALELRDRIHDFTGPSRLRLTSQNAEE